MSTWRSGDLLAAASGLAALFAGFIPWVVDSSGRGVTLLAEEPALFAVLTLVGLALVGSGAMRSSWTALVALLGAFVVAFVLFTAALPAHVTGSRPGFGLFLGGAVGVAAIAAGVLNAVEREGETF